MKTLIEKARDYAINNHNLARHIYGDKQPYWVHLNHVYDIAMLFISLIPDDEKENVLAACYTHDLIEDCRQTYNHVKAMTNERVAEITYALTNEKGKNRKERANGKYYEGIRNTPYATFVKICDRIANHEYSIQTNSRMADVYAKEYEYFYNELYSPSWEPMWKYLRALHQEETLKERK